MLLRKIFAKRRNSLDSILDRGIDQLFEKYRTEFDSVGDMLSQLDWDLSTKEILSLIEQELSTVDTTDDIESSTKDLVSIAFNINTYIYSHYKYSYNQLSAYQIPDGNFVNCMAIAQLIHFIWDNLLYTETLAGITSQHFIAILPLPNGKFLSLDGEPALLDSRPTSRIQYPSNYPWLIVGDNNQFYIGATLMWIASECRKMNEFKLAEDNYKSALTIFPENPDLLFNYGNLLYNIGKYEEAHDKYTMSVQLYPKSVAFRDALETVKRLMGKSNKANSTDAKSRATD